MSEKIKPCPFCGNQPKTYWDHECEISQEGFNIICCFAHAMGVYKDEVIEKWNGRYTPSVHDVKEFYQDE